MYSSVSSSKYFRRNLSDREKSIYTAPGTMHADATSSLLGKTFRRTDKLRRAATAYIDQGRRASARGQGVWSCTGCRTSLMTAAANKNRHLVCSLTKSASNLVPCVRGTRPRGISSLTSGVQTALLAPICYRTCGCMAAMRPSTLIQSQLAGLEYVLSSIETCEA
ncbi:hypothetical protein DAEQUDRAFT_730512 [Daedalea quercina L-15889]|uniref:Uncharacterized protein n=1 Tax=Daedalea quercina L-15889 TaxID=1314783 RepID=A0A165MV79_9APHY|nr:hypothetical protein DAEQUDRAFT_730512 [Daedalea quercina L-15889]